MIKLFSISRQLLYLLLLTGCINTSASYGNHILCISVIKINKLGTTCQKDHEIISDEINQLNLSLQSLLIKNDFDGSRLIVDRIIQKINNDNIGSKTLSDSYYFIGVYYSFTRNLNKAINYFKLSVALREKNQEYDERYARALYNLGTLYGRLGDFKRLEDYSMNSLDIEKFFFGESSPDLISTYSSLIIAYIELQEYEKAINYSNIALTIANNNPDRVSPVILADLYNNLGVCFYRLADFSKAKIYLDKTESIYKISHINNDGNYMNLMNSLAVTYGALGLSEKSDEYYEKGIALAVSNNSSLAYNIINSYSGILGNAGNEKKGKALLSGVLVRAKAKFGEDSRSYIVVLNNYADYLREYKIDNAIFE